MYLVEDVEHQELFTLKVRDGEIVRYEYVWAYTYEEAQSKAEQSGLEVLDGDEIGLC